MDKEDEFSRKDTRSNRRSEDKLNGVLNKLIGLVSVGIVIALIVIFTTDDSEPEQAEPAEVIEESSEPQPSETDVVTEPGDVEESTEEPTEGTLEEQEQEQEQQPEQQEEVQSEQQDNTVEESASADVAEVWTNETWTPHPTEQTGAHASTYETGHIDYEEKLQAFYSVLPLEQDQSILWSAKNNGSATTSVAVISSNDKAAIYRVAIEWVDGEGWLPVQVEVLNTLP